MELFETMRLENGTIKRLTYHFERMMRGSVDLGFDFSVQQWNQIIDELQSRYTKGVWRVKVTNDQQGSMHYTVAELPDKVEFTAKLQLIDDQTPIEERIHKTSNRDHLLHDHQTDLVLLYDQSGKILEFDIGNILMKKGDCYFTPTYDTDLLQGCMRQILLDEDRIETQDIEVSGFTEAVKQGELKPYLINSLREVVPVEMKFETSDE
ncbi:aminotransferase class IV [Staphylococcus auricularis]|uniref:aminotransferase class IV n=1 Tax=Staphylococcus auricularis TaxID=29379 RepID=UPI00248E9FBE|nr:aminotransferase class IV [Staphylococcus auricularis]